VRVVAAAATTLALAAVAAGAATPSSDQDRFLIVRPANPKGTIALHAWPGGAVRVRVSRSTGFGSPLTFSVARVRGHWLGVRSEALPNGRLGWIDARRSSLRRFTTRLWIEADLSQRELVLHRGFEVLRRMPIAIGRGGSPTPIGRFAVTDKLLGHKLGGGFGCCVLALTGHQTRLPAGWIGGDRIAIHGGDESMLGRAVSAGCLHARASDLRALMRIVPLGTPVEIHP
jgi:lipoprotein-anchoring transpeptidase ErfK/SrfK